MTKQETLKVMALIKAVYSKFGEGMNVEYMAGIWYELLSDLKYQDVQQALKRWMATEKWAPTIADIRLMVLEVNQDNVDDWTEGWNQVTRAISKYGYTDQTGALASMDEVTRECVKAIGWMNICNSEEIGVERGHFRTMYEQRKERIRKSEVIPNALKNPVELKLVGVGKSLDELTG